MTGLNSPVKSYGLWISNYILFKKNLKQNDKWDLKQ